MILLVVDTQKLNMTNKLYNFDSLVSNIEQLITIALKNKIEIVYIRHDDGSDTELTEGKEGFDIYGKSNQLHTKEFLIKPSIALLKEQAYLNT